VAGVWKGAAAVVLARRRWGATAVGRGVGRVWRRWGAAEERARRRAERGGDGVREERVSESERARRGCGGYISLLCRVPRSGTRQRRLSRVPANKHSAKTGKDSFIIFKYSLPSVPCLTLGKALFVECLFWTLGKVHFYLFLFFNQTFCDMFLHYVDLHGPFWDNYNSVFYS
jgi:hypothetical protein